MRPYCEEIEILIGFEQILFVQKTTCSFVLDYTIMAMKCLCVVYNLRSSLSLSTINFIVFLGVNRSVGNISMTWKYRAHFNCS